MNRTANKSASLREPNPVDLSVLPVSATSTEEVDSQRLLQRLKEHETEKARLIDEIAALKRLGEEREEIMHDLGTALVNIKLLHGFLPICASCKKIRDATGSWNFLETYICEHSEAAFTHGLCPECEHQLYPQLFTHK